MIDDFAEDDYEEEDEEEEESLSESVETTTTRFGRFMSPLAFSKFSETLGEFLKSCRFLIKMGEKYGSWSG